MSARVDDPFDLARFVAAQEGILPQALAELRAGRKRSHWMWFVFPQIAGLGQSAMARRYAIAGADEARAYLAHPLIGRRLIEASRVVAAADCTVDQIMGAIDAIKLRSSMTLFAAVADDPAPFVAVLDRFYAGKHDATTLAYLMR